MVVQSVISIKAVSIKSSIIIFLLKKKLQELLHCKVPYFFGYKMELFSFQNNPTDLDLSYKTDLDLWDCLGRVKLVLKQNFIGLI